MSVLFACSACAAVFPLVVTPKLNAVWFGTASTEPRPETVIERSVAWGVSPFAPPGSPTPAKATTAAIATPTRARRRTFIETSSSRFRGSTAPRQRPSQRLCGFDDLRGGAVRLEVRPPVRRDRRSGEPDEECRRRRPWRPPQGHRDLVKQPVPLAEVARRA